MHAPQFADALYSAGHVLQAASVHWFWHLHVQFPTVPLTLCACPLQSVALVHSRTQLGYPV